MEGGEVATGGQLGLIGNYPVTTWREEGGGSREEGRGSREGGGTMEGGGGRREEGRLWVLRGAGGRLEVLKEDGGMKTTSCPSGPVRSGD